VISYPILPSSHSNHHTKNRRDLERVQKVDVRVILQTRYTNYQNGMKMLKLDTLEERRKLFCLRFAKGCLKNEKVKSLFPKKENNHKMKNRKVETLNGTKCLLYLTCKGK
jgi:hypothetical protein